jgi:hypothetical protein
MGIQAAAKKTRHKGEPIVNRILELTPEQEAVFKIYLMQVEVDALDMADYARSIISTFDSSRLRNPCKDDSPQTSALKTAHRDLWIAKEALSHQYRAAGKLEEAAWNELKASEAADRSSKRLGGAVSRKLVRN